MTDRELLEKAARAAGIEHEGWKPPGPGYGGHYALWLGDVSCRMWNPLENDGDAFRLLLDCNLYMKHSLCTALGQENDACGGDYHAAFRRAIVRAAAAMEDNQ